MSFRTLQKCGGLAGAREVEARRSLSDGEKVGLGVAAFLSHMIALRPLTLLSLVVALLGSACGGEETPATESTTGAETERAAPVDPQAAIDHTVALVATVHEAVATYRSEFPDAPCPTVDQLAASEHITDAQRMDSWDKPFEILCNGDEIEVRSPGPDRILLNQDDIL